MDEIVFQILLRRMGKKKRYIKPITRDQIHDLLIKTRETLSKEPFLLDLKADIVIVGDLHGNVDDLIRIFEKLRYPPARRYLFLGDYVDRGECGFEVMLLLFALKVKFPEHIFLLRGNHECESLTGVYGFHHEMLEKYDQVIYEDFIETFYEMPLCALVGQRIFCVHGGISPEVISIDELRKLEKPYEFPTSGVITDLVWSDPDVEVEGFVPSTRGCGYLYGPEALDAFLAENDIDLVVRSHEVCDEGIYWPYAAEEDYADMCVTIFSNTDYCERANTGAVLCVSEDLTVTVEMLEMVFPESKKKNILLPYWLTDFITNKESERQKIRNAKKMAENADPNHDDLETKVITTPPPQVSGSVQNEN